MHHEASGCTVGHRARRMSSAPGNCQGYTYLMSLQVCWSWHSPSLPEHTLKGWTVEWVLSMSLPQFRKDGAQLQGIQCIARWQFGPDPSCSCFGVTSRHQCWGSWLASGNDHEQTVNLKVWVPGVCIFPFPALLLPAVCMFQVWGWHHPLDPVQWDSCEVCPFSCHWSDWRPLLHLPSPSSEQSWH